MDPISIVGASVAIIGFIGHGLSNPNSKESNTYGRLAAVYGKIPALVIKFGLPETFEALENVDKVTHGNDQIALAFKNSYVFDCSMTIVAARSLNYRGSIVLQLTYIGLYHCSGCYHCALPTIPESGTLGFTRVFHCKLDFCLLFGILCCYITTENRSSLRSPRRQKLDFGIERRL